MHKPGKPIGIPYENILPLSKNMLKQDGVFFVLDREKHGLSAVDAESNKLFDLRFPLPYPTIQEKDTPESYLERVRDKPEPHLILLLQVGSASMAWFDQGELRDHKVIRKYMTRKEQGKSQLNHLKTKGKSRLGSRIRLQQSEQFFDEINEKIASWNVIEHVNAVLYSCPVRWWPMLFDADPAPPFSKDDPRLRRIPIEVNTPNMEELLRVNKSVSRGYMVVHQPIDFDFIEDFLP
jgi:hypothetical protein